MSNKLASYRAYKEDDFARSILVFSMVQPEAVPFYGLQFRYALDQGSQHFYPPKSPLRILRGDFTLFSPHEARKDELPVSAED